MASTVRGGLTWTSQLAVAGVNEDDNMASLSLTSTGQPRIAYFDENAGTNETEVRFAERIAGTWSNEFVANRGLNNKLGVSLKLTSTNDPRIGIFSFFEDVQDSFGDSRYASRTGNTWTVEDIKKNDDFVGEFIHLALTSTDSPRAASVNSTTSDLEYSTKESGNWDTTVIGERGAPAFLRLNSSDKPFVVFADDGDNSLKVASNTNGTWTDDPAIAAFNGNSRSISMALNGDNPYISFVDAVGLKLAKKSGGTWTVETVVADATLQANVSSIVLDSLGNPYIAYETGGEVVKVAYKAGGSWLSSTVGNGTLNFSLGEALAIRGTTLGIVYTLPDESNLMYASASLSTPGMVSTQIAGITGVYNTVFGKGSTGSGSSSDRAKFFETNGLISVTMALDGSYRGYITLEGQKLPFSGALDSNAMDTISVRRPGHAPLRLTLTQRTSPVRVTGSIRVNGDSIPFSASRGLYRKHPFADRDFTVGIPAPSGVEGGTGYAMISFAENGNASVSGRLADGSAFSSSSRTIDDRHGNWIVPLHVFLYSRDKGMLWGEFKLPKSPSNRESAVTGSLVWLRSSDAPAKISPLIFLEEASPRGERLPSKGSLVSESSKPVAFELQIDPDANILTDPITISGTWPGNNKPSFDSPPSGFRFSVNDKTGLFSGTFRRDENGKSITTQFKGVLFGKPTDLGSGAGYFNTSRESGEVKIVVE